MGLLLRASWGAWAAVEPTFRDDALWYHATARNLARGNGYRNPFTGLLTAWWPPGYPVLLSLPYSVLGPDPVWGALLNALAGAVACVTCWRLASRAFSPRVGLVALALLTFFPGQILWVPLVLSEPLFAAAMGVVMVTGVIILDYERQQARVWPWIAWGAGVGTASLVRGEAAAFAIVAALTVGLARGWRRGARVLALALVGAALALSPWTLRNAVVFGSFVPISTSFGRTLWVGNNEAANGSFTPQILASMEAELARRGGMQTPGNEPVADGHFRREALGFMATHPRRELELVFMRLYHLFRGDHDWAPWYRQGTTRLPRGGALEQFLIHLGNRYYAAVLVLALVGFFMPCPFGDPQARRFIRIAVLYWVAFFAVLFGCPRYHFALVPALCVFAAWALVRAGDWVGARRRAVSPSS